MSKIPLLIEPNVGECPYCLRRVGIVGNWFALLLGTRFHGCDFRNVAPPDLSAITRRGEEIDAAVAAGRPNPSTEAPAILTE